MIPSHRFLEEARHAGFRFFTGVPCSFLTPLIDELVATHDVPYLPAANEGDAVAIAAGAELGGSLPVVFFQNSGLGNAVNPLTSLTWTFRIPVLVVTTWRGEPQAAPDEPQHELMGAITPSLLDAMQIPWELVPTEPAELGAVLARAAEHLASQRTPYGLIVRKGTLGDGPGRTGASSCAPSAVGEKADVDGPLLDQDADQRVAAEACENDALLTTTGFTGRALYAIGDRANQFYMVGSMGCLSSLALGLATVRPERRVVAIDGDGAFLMRMGAIATIGTHPPPNLVHVLFDNGVHDSTGAQATVSRSIDPVGVALACGYPEARRVSSVEELGRELRRKDAGLRFLHVRTEPRANRKLPRPETRPHEVARRLREWLREGDSTHHDSTGLR